MAHDHRIHGPQNFDRAFAIGIALNLGFVRVEAGFGFWVNSLSLLADAGHNLSDVFGLLLAWGGSALARRHPTALYTYGLRRASIMAALLNALILFAVVAVIVWEAVLRFGQPVSIASETVIAVATVGIVINGVTAWLFMVGSGQDLNIRGAYLHMAADALVSFGVVVAAIAMAVTGWFWLDPGISLVIAGVIAASTWGVLRESLRLSLDAVPAQIDPTEVRAYFAELPGVEAVHDLHIWAMGTTDIALTVHLVKSDAVIDDALLAQINAALEERFGIRHITVQFERGDPGSVEAL